MQVNTHDELGGRSPSPVARPPVSAPATTLSGRLLAVIVLAVIVPATTLIGGCGAASPPARHGTTQSCFAFGVQALDRHETITRMPPACAGLSHEQINAVVGRVLRDVVGPMAKAPFRSRAVAESRYLAGLVRSAPAARPPANQAAPTPATTGLPASLAALVAWIVTAAAGLYLLAGLLTRTRSGRRRFQAAGMPPAVIGGHAGLGLAGLGVWIAFMTTSEQSLGWIAVGITFLVAGLGMATLLTAVPDSQRSGPSTASTTTASATTATVRPPVLVIALHGVLATIAILLVLLAVIGSG